MPPPAYTPRRRLVMQAVMVVLLGATVGLAAWVRERKVDPPIRLTEAVKLKGISVRLVAGWQTRILSDAQGPQALRSVDLGDPRGKQPARSLIVAVEPAPTELTAEKYLVREMASKPSETTPVQVAGEAGLRAMAHYKDPSGDPWTITYVSVVLPMPRVAVMVEYWIRDQPPGEKDEQILQQVLASVQPSVEPGGPTTQSSRRKPVQGEPDQD